MLLSSRTTRNNAETKEIERKTAVDSILDTATYFVSVDALAIVDTFPRECIHSYKISFFLHSPPHIYRFFPRIHACEKENEGGDVCEEENEGADVCEEQNEGGDACEEENEGGDACEK
ncbi:hypothetical protein AVEN_7470-1 [Araneus ventricosus]|uniref:Uncharacterized protein n=1 Tax=Araneus ventricosus TaxID=182803 RepID=A0A4Y2VR20_ARAVE|nr:hypothetical protein AVEN_7470-1 [Araneus ventricosus]